MNLFKSISSYILLSSSDLEARDASLTCRLMAVWFVGILCTSSYGEIWFLSFSSSLHSLQKLEWNLFLIRKLDISPHFFLLIPALSISEETNFYYSTILDSDVLDFLLKCVAACFNYLSSDVVVLFKTLYVYLRRIYSYLDLLVDLCFSRFFDLSFFLL